MGPWLERNFEGVIAFVLAVACMTGIYMWIT